MFQKRDDVVSQASFLANYQFVKMCSIAGFMAHDVVSFHALKDIYREEHRPCYYNLVTKTLTTAR